MKLWYNYKSKDPTYFIQQGIRNGKKVTTKNVKRIGKHSELLAITDDPLAYAKEQVRLFNQEYKEGKAEIQFKIDFDEKLIASGDIGRLTVEGRKKSRKARYSFIFLSSFCILLLHIVSHCGIIR